MPRRSTHVEVADFDAEFVVFDPRNTMVHHLSGWIAIVFDACDGESSRAELAADAIDYWHGEIDEAHRRVDEAIEVFENLGILEGLDAVTPPPCIGCEAAGIRRRRRWFTRR